MEVNELLFMHRHEFRFSMKGDVAKCFETPVSHGQLIHQYKATKS